MSLILDALNKAQRERQEKREPVPDLSSVHSTPSMTGFAPERKFGNFAIPVAVIALIVAIAWVGWRLVQPEEPVPSRDDLPVAVDTPTDTPRTDEVETVSAEPPASSKPIPVVHPEPAAQRPTPPVQPEVTDLYQAAQRNIANADASAEAGAGEAPSEPAPAPEVPAPSAEPSDTETSENATVEPVRVEPERVNPVTVGPPNEQEANTTAGETLAPPPDSVHDRDDVPYVHELSLVMQDKLPSIMYSSHNAERGNRSVQINGAIHRAGIQLADGLVLEEILSDGVILRYRGKPFKLKALNSWVSF